MVVLDPDVDVKVLVKLALRLIDVLVVFDAPIVLSKFTFCKLRTLITSKQALTILSYFSCTRRLHMTDSEFMCMRSRLNKNMNGSFE